MTKAFTAGALALANRSPGRILVVEDNPKLAELVRSRLVEQAFSVDVTYSGRDGEEAVTSGAYDALILDVMLPDHNGVDLCRNLRRHGVGTPVLMLTALAETNDKVAGLNAGADDYLAKPFELDELMARVRALVRRAQTPGAVLRFDDIEMNVIRRTVIRAGKSIILTAKEFALLEFFLRNANRVLTRTIISERVWDLVFETDTNVVEVYISRVRRKVDKGFERQLIHTVIGMGYILSIEPPA